MIKDTAGSIHMYIKQIDRNTSLEKPTNTIIAYIKLKLKPQILIGMRQNTLCEDFFHPMHPRAGYPSDFQN